MSSRTAESLPIAFPGKRHWLLLLGSVLFTLCAAGILIYMIYLAVLVVIVWIQGPIGLLLMFETLVILVLFVIFGSVMLVGVVFFGWAVTEWWKTCLHPSPVVELLPEGIRGNTNIGDVIVPWSCIASVKLESPKKAATIGIETANWPPYPLWKDCPSGVRRDLWKRHNRRQTPFHLYLHDAAASPEVILKAIEAELTSYRSTISESE